MIGPNGSLVSMDFCWIWVSGKFAASIDPAQIYQPSAFAAAQNIFYRPGECQFMHQYVYPPTFLFFSYPLGLIPYFTAYVLWITTTIVVYLAAVYSIIPRAPAVVAALTPFSVVMNILAGHNGFLTAGLVGLSLGLLQGRPWLSGVFLGLLTYKPQFGILFPLTLLLSRNWRVLASATATGAVLGIAAALAFGSRGWPSFIESLLDRQADLSPDGQFQLMLHSTFGLVQQMGGSELTAWTIHLGVAITVTLAVCVIWTRQIPFSLKAAALCLGSVMVTPYLLAYDLCNLSIAVAFVVRDALSRGFLPGERFVILICWAGLLSIWIPLTQIICCALLFIIVRRILNRATRYAEPNGSPAVGA